MVDSQWMDWAWAQAWQLTALIVIVAIVVRCFAKHRPHLAYVLWLVVLAKCLTPPMIASPAGIFSRLQALVSFSSGDAGPPVEAESKVLPPATWNDLIAAAAQDESRFHEQGVRQWKEESAVGMGESEDEEWLIGSRGADDSLTGRVATVIRQPRSNLWIPSLWLTVSLLVIAAAGWRTMACLRRIARGDIESRPDLQELLDDLRRRLRIRQRVRLLITRSVFGPAVIGLFRPTIVLPSIVVARRSIREIEAILAHELIHIRRGDLWTGLVQVLAQGVWWFHPLVWFANRRATRASEACCDQETITELGCDPGAYAESLLDILAIRNQLVPVPAFPGVRPVDVTRERLERIMQIGQGCPKRTPWWCWMAMVVVAAVTLPGAAIVAEGVVEDPDSPPTQTAPQADRPAEPVPSSFERPVDATTGKDEASPDRELQSDAAVPQKRSRPFLHWNLPEAADGLVALGLRSPRVLIEADRLLQRPGKEDADQNIVEAEGGVMLYVGSVLVSAEKALLHVTYGRGSRPKSIEEVSMELHGKVHWRSPGFRLSAHRLIASFRMEGNPKGSVVALQQLSAQSLDADNAADSDPGSRMIRLELFSRLPSELKDPRRLQLIAKKLEVKRHEMPKESGADQLHYRLEGDVDLRIANLAVGCGTCRFIFPADPTSADSANIGFGAWAEFEKDVRLSAGPPADGMLLVDEEFSATAERATLQPFLYRQKDRVVCLGSSLGLSGKATFRNRDYEFSAGSIGLKYAPQYPLDVNTPQQPLRLTEQMELSGNVRILSRSEAQKQVIQGDRVLFDVSTKSVSIERSTSPGVDEIVPRLFGASVVFQPNLQKAKPAVKDRSKYSRGKAGSNDLITITYPVADLVVPVSKLHIKITEDGTNHLKMGLADQVANLARYSNPKSHTADFSRLIELVTSTIEPQSWDEVGGPGSIREYQTTLSLVIRQTQQVHDEIADLLGQLRRLQDLQVTLELSALRVPADFKPELELTIDDQDVRGALITLEKVTTLREAAEKNSHAGHYLLPRASLINAQGLEINVPQFGRRAPAFQFVPVISADRKFVRLSLAVGARDPLDAMSRVSTFVIPADKALVVDVTDELQTNSVAGLRPGQVGAILRGIKKDSGERFLLLITPRVTVAEEGEVLGGDSLR